MIRKTSLHAEALASKQLRKRLRWGTVVLLLLLMSSLWQPLHATELFRPRLGTGNDDNYADLVIGEPGEDWLSTTDAGIVQVLYADDSGIPTQSGDLWRQGSGGIPGTGEMWDAFVTALAAGDFNGDGCESASSGILRSRRATPNTGLLFRPAHRLFSSSR